MLFPQTESAMFGQLSLSKPVEQKSERLREKAPRPFLFGVWLEEELDRHLSNARIGRLSCPERPKRVAAVFVEGRDVFRAVQGARADALGRKVRVVKNVEVFG